MIPKYEEDIFNIIIDNQCENIDNLRIILGVDISSKDEKLLRIIIKKFKRMNYVIRTKSKHRKIF